MALATSSIDLPPLAVAQTQALGLLGEPDVSVAELTRVVELDPMYTAAVLRAANSASSAPIEALASAHQAIVRIGLDETKRIVTAGTVKQAFGLLDRAGLDEPELWRHLLGTAVAASYLAGGGPTRGEAFTAGLLHDLGRLAMATSNPDQYREVAEAVRAGTDAGEAERQILGFDHATWGGAVAQAWRLPPAIVEAIEHHHDVMATGLPGRVARARLLANAMGVGDGLVRPSNDEGGDGPTDGGPSGGLPAVPGPLAAMFDESVGHYAGALSIAA